jgi:hypothetical protein
MVSEKDLAILVRSGIGYSLRGAFEFASSLSL